MGFPNTAPAFFSMLQQFFREAREAQGSLCVGGGHLDEQSEWGSRVGRGVEWRVMCILHGGVSDKAHGGQLETSCKGGKYILKMWSSL